MDSNKNHTKKIIFIIILLLAITFLGIFFIIKSMFLNIDAGPEDESATIREHITEQLVSSNKRLFSPEGSSIIERGGSEIWTIGIRNDKPVPLNYQIKIILLNNTEGNFSWFKYNRSNFTLKTGEVDLRNIRVNVPLDCCLKSTKYKQGSYVDNEVYSFKLEIFDNEQNNIYAENEIIKIVQK